MKKIQNFLKAAVVIAIALAFIMPSAAVVTNIEKTSQKNYSHPLTHKQIASAQMKDIPQTMNTLADDVLISALNPDEDDLRPKITINNEGTIVITYEQVNDILSTTIPIVFSDDNGASFIMAFEFDSIDFTEGSGILYGPDIKYCAEEDYFYWAAVDPLAEMYNEESAWIPGDIANAQNAVWWGISSSDATGYHEGALTFVGQWFIGFTVHDLLGFEKDPGLGYFYYDIDTETILFPNEVDSGWAPGYYYDGCSVLNTVPASKPEMVTATDRMYMVMETQNETLGPVISLKSTVTDLDPESDEFLFTSGGGPGGMDKYADIEVWPWQGYLAENATDPEIWASNNNAVVVYMQEGDVKCAYSSDDGDTWDTSTVVSDASYPSVYMVGTTAYCIYVQDGNLFLDTSEDGGATWLGEPIQINDEDGTVVADVGCCDITKGGIVWEDSRNEARDIYWNKFLSLSPDTPVLDGPTEVKIDEETEFTATSTDPQDDDVQYMFDWGDGSTPEWTDSFTSGATGSDTHTWDAEGTFEVKVKAKDVAGHESEWSEPLPITVPRSKAVTQPTFLDLLERFFPEIYRIIINIVG